MTLEGLLKDVPANTADFIRRMLKYNPVDRLSVEEALMHPYVKHFFREEDLRLFKGKINISLDENTKFSVSKYRKILYEFVGITQ